MRKAFSIIVVVLLSLALLVLLGLWQLGRSLAAVGIEQVDYRLQQPDWHQLRFSHLSFVYRAENSRTAIALSDVKIGWQWQAAWVPQVSTVAIGQAQITHSPQDSAPAANKSPGLVSLPDTWSLPAAFPQHIAIKGFLASLPCPAGNCWFAGSLAVQAGRQSLQLRLTASPGKRIHPQHHLQLTADYHVREKFPHLEASLTLEPSLEMHLQTHLAQTQEMYWSGTLTGRAVYPQGQAVDPDPGADTRGDAVDQVSDSAPVVDPQGQAVDADSWWRAALLDWHIQPGPVWDDALQQPLTLKAEWNLALMPLLTLANSATSSVWQQAFTGRLALDARVPVPIGFPGLGKLSGEAAINLAATAGQVDHYQLLADIELSKPVLPEGLAAQGLLMDTAQLTVNSAATENVDLARIPVAIDARFHGPVAGTSSAQLSLDMFAKKMIVEKLDAHITAKTIVPVAGLRFRNVILDLHTSGVLQPDKFAFEIAKPSYLSADVAADGYAITARSAHWASSQLSLAGRVEQGQIQWPEIAISSKFSLAVAALSHPQLRPTSWLWQADIQGQPQQFKLTGELAVDNSLSVKHQLEGSPSGLAMEWQLADIFMLAGNPVAETLVAWPPLLTLAQGKIKATGKVFFDLEKNHLARSQTSILLSDLGGVYDTLVFQGITTNLNLLTDPGMLKIATDEININQLSKGFSAGPLVAGAIYQAELKNPARGTLDLRYLRGDVMGGTLSTPAQVFNFNEGRQRVLLELKNIDLAILLKQHPSSEISGNGRLSGKVPIDISDQGISVVRGVVSAEPPGGQLQYHSARASAIAESQPSMKLITQALDDFHYSVLASEVNYDESGQLLLSVTLQGKNPALENGRPINFNISLEEDLPAMITSIQLANNISDIVKRRLQERLQKKGTTKAGD